MPSSITKGKSSKAKHKAPSFHDHGGGTSGKAVDKVLHCLAHLASMGWDDPDKNMVGLCSGINPTSSTLRSACAQLRKDGMIEPKGFRLSAKGAAAVGSHVMPPITQVDFHNKLKDMIGGGPKTRQIFDLLSDGQDHTRSEIAKHIQIDPSKSTFRNAFAPFNRSMKLLEQVSKDSNETIYRLTDTCFPFGRFIVV